jgi:hypothetical protein
MEAGEGILGHRADDTGYQSWPKEAGDGISRGRAGRHNRTKL